MTPSIRTCKECSVPKPIAKFKQRTPTTWNWKCNRCIWLKYRYKENERRRKGTRITGEDNYQSKLTWDLVRFIRSPTGRKMQGTVLAEFCGVTPSIISKIKANKMWKEET